MQKNHIYDDEIHHHMNTYIHHKIIYVVDMGFILYGAAENP